MAIEQIVFFHEKKPLVEIPHENPSPSKPGSYWTSTHIKALKAELEELAKTEAALASKKYFQSGLDILYSSDFSWLPLLSPNIYDSFAFMSRGVELMPESKKQAAAYEAGKAILNRCISSDANFGIFWDFILRDWLPPNLAEEPKSRHLYYSLALRRCNELIRLNPGNQSFIEQRAELQKPLKGLKDNPGDV